MGRSWILVIALLGLAGCGSPAAPVKTTTETAPPPPDAPAPDAGLQSGENETPAVPETVATTPPPIAIPNARLYEGYVVGGMPSKQQFDLAVEAGFDSAMSLMDNEEEGIRETAPYATSIGVRYIRFTIKDKSDLTEAMAWEFASTLSMLGKPAIIHSAKGERVGAIFALMAFFVDELTTEEALAVGAAAGMGSLNDHVRSLLVR